MKALTQQEIEQFVTTFRTHLEGAQLQDVLANDRGLALGFHRGGTYWLILDLVPNTPMMLLFHNQCPFKKASKTKPAALFLNSHGRDLLFQDMWVEQELGRVVKIRLRNSSKECEIEVQLLPRSANLIVKAEGKQIAWEKPQELKPAPHVENPPEPRSLEEIHTEWLAQQNSKQKSSLDPVAQWEKQRQKDIDKKTKALVEIEKQISSDKDQVWAEAGQHLKASGLTDIPEELKNFIDREKSLSWNIENCFAKSKQLHAKKDGARTRLEILSNEIQKLEKARFKERVVKPSLVDLMQKTDARGRKLNLESGAIAYCGKSAVDNLALLRQAKAWDYWLHLRDFPGAHAIIHRQRDQLITEEEFMSVSTWVAKESLGSKGLQIGQKVAVVIVECRFVRPIKGDKLGRVNYHSERTLNFTLR